MLLQSVPLYSPYKGLIQDFCFSSSPSAGFGVMLKDNVDTNNITSLFSIFPKICLLLYMRLVSPLLLNKEVGAYMRFSGFEMFVDVTMLMSMFLHIQHLHK